MIVAVVEEPVAAEHTAEADIVELRADLLDFEALSNLQKSLKKPILITLRSKEEGGACHLPEKAYEEALFRLGKLLPEMIDLEARLPENFLKRFANAFPSIKRIHSLHFFREEKDLEALYTQLTRLSADYYKMAVSLNSSSSMLRFVQFALTKPKNFTAIPMGPYGSAGRVILAALRKGLSYVRLSSSNENPLGQMTLQEMLHLYNYRTLPSPCNLYGLIGDPVDASIGHLFHNPKLQGRGVYLKFPVPQEDLAPFVREAKKLPFHGFSVTMPHKEAILSHLDQRDPDAEAIGAVNTVLIQEGRWHGYNTDGQGALNAIEKLRPLRHASLLILGSGATARAIAHEAKKRGANARLFSRKPDKSSPYPCFGYEELPQFLKDPSAITLKCHPYPLPHLSFLPSHLVMDAAVAKGKTPFLQAAEAKGAETLDFLPMFREQALLQQKLWGW